MGKELVIVGAGEFAEIAYEYFTYDSRYTVVAFAVEKDYLAHKKLFDLDVIPLEDIMKHYPPEQAQIFVAVTYTGFNRVRTRLYQACKAMGYSFATYVSSKAFVWRNVEIGENTFIFENNTLQYHSSIGNNVILWSGNHIGHRTRVDDNCYLSSHVVLSGYCTIGRNSFIGVNAAVSDHIEIPQDTWIAPGSIITRASKNNGLLFMPKPTTASPVSSYQYFNVEES